MWSPNATFTFQWRSGAELLGSGPTYTVKSKDAGDVISLVATGISDGYSSATSSDDTVAVANGTFATTPSPGMTGTVKVGSTLSAVAPTWSPEATFTYEWKLGATHLADGDDFTVPASAAGSTLTLIATGSAAGYDSASSTFSTATVSAGTFETVDPIISGTAKVGSTLTVTAPVWSPAAAFTYEWKAGGATVDTGLTHVITAAELNTRITVTARGTASGFVAATATSAPYDPTSHGEFAVTPSPTISGAAKVGSVLTAVAPVWTPTATFTYIWKSGDTVVATGNSYTPTGAYAGKPITLVATGNAVGYLPSTSTVTTSPLSTGILATTAPMISGDAKVGSTLTVSAPSWTPAAAFTYQWKAGTSVVVAGTSHVLTAADAGKTITVTAVGAATGYTDESVTSSAVGPVALGTFAATPAAAIAGTAKVGWTLSVAGDPGWGPAAAFTYTWKSGESVVGTGTSYTVTPSNAGHTITLVTSGAADGYITASSASSTGPAANGTLIAGSPTITGGMIFGSTLAANTGNWGPVTVSIGYQWNRDGTAIGGAIGSSYALTPSDVDASLTVTVTGSAVGYDSASVTSARSDDIDAADLGAATPKISGTPSVGKKLTVSTGTWTPTPATWAIQWQRDGSDIAGANGATYTLVKRDAGADISVEVTGSKPGFATETATSADFAVKKQISTATPAITGTAKVGKTLKAKPGKWKPTTVKFSYQWERNGKDISGADNATYKVVAKDLGKKITVTVTAAKSGYTSDSETSKETKKVAKK
jgi:hypothetical protein